MISFVDCETKVFKVLQMDERQHLEVEMVKQTYKTSFIVTHMTFEVHQASQQLVVVLGGTG